VLPLPGVPAFPAHPRADHADQRHADQPSRCLLRALGNRAHAPGSGSIAGCPGTRATVEDVSTGQVALRRCAAADTSALHWPPPLTPGPDVAARRRASGRCVVVPVNPVWIVPGQGNCFHCRVDAEFGHEVLQMSADGIHGEVQLLRHCVTVRGAPRQAG